MTTREDSSGELGTGFNDFLGWLASVLGSGLEQADRPRLALEDFLTSEGGMPYDKTYGSPLNPLNFWQGGFQGLERRVVPQGLTPEVLGGRSNPAPATPLPEYQRYRELPPPPAPDPVLQDAVDLVMRRPVPRPAPTQDSRSVRGGGDAVVDFLSQMQRSGVQ